MNVLKLRFMPNQLLEKLNEVFWEAGNGKTTMTFFLALINNSTGEMLYSNAGHNFPLIFPQDASDHRIKKRKNKNSLHSSYFPEIATGCISEKFFSGSASSFSACRS